MKARPNKELIEYVERLLESAKTGELQCLTTICSWTEQGISAGWCIPDQCETKYHLVELDRLKLQMLLQSEPVYRQQIAELLGGY